MENQNTKQISNSFWLGIIVIFIGGLLLLDRLDYDLVPRWLTSWKTLLIAIGLAVGVRKNFQGIGWLILICIGSFFLIEDIVGLDFEVRRYIFPAIVISIGLLILFRSVLHKPTGQTNQWVNADEKKNDLLVDYATTGDERIDITSIFGGSKRKVFSKNFTGGQITSVFGGSEIDLTQADIQNTVVLDIVCTFGGTKLIVPANWEVKPNITGIMGGIDDQRKYPTAYTPSKILVLTGICMFGGVEIKSH